MRCVQAPTILCIILLSVWLGLGTQSALGHGHEPPWLVEDGLDRGCYIDVQVPRVIRALGPFDVKVSVRNIAGKQDTVVAEIRYLTADRQHVITHPLHALLPTQRESFEAYRSVLADMHQASSRGDVAAVEKLAHRRGHLLKSLATSVVADRHRITLGSISGRAGEAVEMLVEIELLEGVSHRTVTRLVTIPIHPSLPQGDEPSQRWWFNIESQELGSIGQRARRRTGLSPVTWFAGDQHLHTTYSLDALILDGTTETVTEYAATAELIDLDWIIVTDHSNVHYSYQGTDYYTSQQFASGTAQAAAYTASNGLLVLYGQEMGAGRDGLLALPSHYLAYPFASVSTGYLQNPSSGLIYGLANCEDEQVIIDRVSNAGGFGFIAHPFDSGAFSYAEWDFNNGTTGWAGFEIWNDTTGQIDSNDQQSLDQWHDLLNALPGPQGGVLAQRPGFPNAFPVGLGNSDAHVPGLIGATFTYVWLEGFSRSQVVEALMAGRCVASNGPLLFAHLNGARIGEVALLLDGDNDLELTLTTTSEFGPVGDYQLTLYVNGLVDTIVPPSGDPGFSATVVLPGLDLSSPDKFITVRADSLSGPYHAITNPVWLQFTGAGDANADGSVNLTDFPQFSECLTGPQVEHLPLCDIMDLDRDGDVDAVDIAEFQQLFGD